MTDQKKKRIAILQPAYIPWKGYFDLIRMVDEFIFLEEVQYTTDWKNRNLIKSPEGLKWLTIPVRRSGLADKISDIKVAHESWRRKHWLSFEHNYSKAPHFEDNRRWLQDLYLHSDEVSLHKIDAFFIEAINQKLGISTPLTWSSIYEPQGTRAERVLDICKKAGAAVYLSGPAAKAYLDETLFQAEGISVEWMNYKGYPEYHQLYPPFEHGVTILDLLLNEGPNTVNYMKTLITG